MDAQAQSKLIQCIESENVAKPQHVSKFRRFLPQVRELLLSKCKFQCSISIENNFLL